MTNRLKHAYWELSRRAADWKTILFGRDKIYRSLVLSQFFQSPSAITPIKGETAERAAAAARWLVAGQDATPDDGVSYGYFPLSGGWEVSYPETTGYIITSLISYATRTGQSNLVDCAHRMAKWEAGIQMSNGAVQGGKLTSPERQTPAAFNTGMVLDGFVSLLEQRSDDAIALAAEKSADFLVGDLDDQGLFRTNGAFVSADPIKIYNVLCAWALYRLGKMTGSARYMHSAVRSAEGALKFQQANGWFSNNCLSDPLRPLTHTIGYTMQGILEVGVCSDRGDFVAAIERSLGGILRNIGANGALAGQLDAQWNPAARWVCLTGSAQIAIVAYRLAELLGKPEYAAAADRLVDFLKAVQHMRTGVAGIDGAIAGSYPITGGYMTLGYPNWATKYYLDALMIQASRAGVALSRN